MKVIASPIPDRLLETARGGHAGVLVVHREPGVGKTALLPCALEAGQGYRVTKTTGDKSGGVHNRVNVDNATRLATHDYTVGARS